MKYIVFDIDGVLADCSHRLHYIQGENKDYDKFYSDEDDDQVNEMFKKRGIVCYKPNITKE